MIRTGKASLPMAGWMCGGSRACLGNSQWSCSRDSHGANAQTGGLLLTHTLPTSDTAMRAAASSCLRKPRCVSYRGAWPFRELILLHKPKLSTLKNSAMDEERKNRGKHKTVR